MIHRQLFGITINLNYSVGQINSIDALTVHFNRVQTTTATPTTRVKTSENHKILFKSTFHVMLIYCFVEFILL